MDKVPGWSSLESRLVPAITYFCFEQSIPAPRSRTLLNELQNIMRIFLNCLPPLEVANFNGTVWNI